MESEQMLGKDIGRMSDAELSAAAKSLIESREPESLRLDYKETLGVSKDSEKKELAKDVSSFANEQGGALIYGVPEEREGDLPRPKPLAECGIDIDSRLPEQIENILISTVQPPLHALRIRPIDIPEIAPKQLLMIHHPESYWKPHMVEGYQVRRYYRRGNFRAVEMNEREVEAAYLARESARSHTRDFLATASFGNHSGIVLRAVACPVARGQFREMMLHPSISNWLSHRFPSSLNLSMGGEWLPFVDGWRYLGREPGCVSGRLYEVRLFHNGAICLNADAMSACGYGGLLVLERLRQVLNDLFVVYSARALRELAVEGPIVLHIEVESVRNTGCVRDEREYNELAVARGRLEKGERPVRYGNDFRGTVEELERRYGDGDSIVFDDESSVEELVDEPSAVLDRLVHRIATAFGVWR